MNTEHSGLKNPQRSLELLWGTRERPSRGPAPRLSVEQIVRAAIGIADAEGLAGLSMRRVADNLGVGVMSLYRYVPGKDELIDVMYDTVIGETRPADTVRGGWRAKLEWIAWEDWALYHRHPWLLQVAVSRPPLGPNVVAVTETAVTAVSETGLPGREVIAVVELVDAYVRGMVRGSVEAAQVKQQTGVSDEQWWSHQFELWERHFDASRYPTLTRLSDEGAFDLSVNGPLPADELFEFGLQRVLDGIEVRVNHCAHRGKR